MLFLFFNFCLKNLLIFISVCVCLLVYFSRRSKRICADSERSQVSRTYIHKHLYGCTLRAESIRRVCVGFKVCLCECKCWLKTIFFLLLKIVIFPANITLTVYLIKKCKLCIQLAHTLNKIIHVL